MGSERTGRPRKIEKNFVEKCAERYDAALNSRAAKNLERPHIPHSEDGLKAFAPIATGDPLFATDRQAAMKLYGLHTAKRPTRHLVKLQGIIWGNDEAGLAREYVAQLLKNREGMTVRQAIADAVATFAERGSFLERNSIPVSFNSAITTVYAQCRKPFPDASLGFKGAKIFVQPAVAGAMVRQPHRNMTPLPAEGDWVPDTLFWRRRLLNGDVIEKITNNS